MYIGSSLKSNHHKLAQFRETFCRNGHCQYLFSDGVGVTPFAFPASLSQTTLQHPRVGLKVVMTDFKIPKSWKNLSVKLWKKLCLWQCNNCWRLPTSNIFNRHLQKKSISSSLKNYQIKNFYWEQNVLKRIAINIVLRFIALQSPEKKNKTSCCQKMMKKLTKQQKNGQEIVKYVLRKRR